MNSGPLRSIFHAFTLFGAALLLVEFVDEFVFGAREAAWPLIRTDLKLNYAEVGVLLGLPTFIANLIEPLLGILGDVWKRRVIILGGGACYVVALFLFAISANLLSLLLTFILMYPASGAFVGLSQATLMDLDQTGHELNMARWTLAGSIGVVTGALALGAAAYLGLGWRGLFVCTASLMLVVVVILWSRPFSASASENEHHTFTLGFRDALRALRRREVLRWLTLLECSDLMLDILLGYLALYCVDVVHVTATQAGLAVAVWTGAGLLGDFLLIPLLTRVQGLRYLRLSVIIELIIFPLFLLAPTFGLKLVLLVVLGLFNAGWYAILKAQLYSAMPGQSGAVLAVGNVFNMIGALIPLVLGLVAQRFGLGAAMWLLLLGPVALFVGLPRRLATTTLENEV